ncbi:MAG: C10 family peptidase [Bacteroidetes bacterium]|nr:C10 family peptidase [Bacteroidota bacterium]
MKNNILIISCLLWFIAASDGIAQTASPAMAEKAANTWISNTASHDNYQLAGIRDLKNEAGEILAYCFELFPEGYLIFTADQSLPPVLAYSFTGNFSPEAHLANPLKDMLMQDLKARLTYLPNIEDQKKEHNRGQWEALIEGISQHRNFEQWPPPGSTSTGGWLETNWSQSAPYNNLCPLDEVTGLRSVAGCPAITLAMIIHYQKNLNGTQFSDDDDYYHNYSGRQYWIDDDHHEMDFPSFPELNEYFDSIAAKFPAYVPLNTEEIAALIFSCGVAARQVYTSSVSGTFGVDQAYDAYLRFGYADAVLVYDNDTSFYTHMKHNMIDGMPVHLAVLSSTGSGGHNVVTDGYNTDEYYHLNFGWGGSYNGWYLLPDEIPYNLTIIEGAVMDIGVTHVAIDENIAKEKGRLTVYPNPSAGTVNIRLEQPEAGNVQLEVRDIRGRLVYEIYSGPVDKGVHGFIWQADVIYGMYYITMSSNETKQTGKIIIK